MNERACGVATKREANELDLRSMANKNYCEYIHQRVRRRRQATRRQHRRTTSKS